MLPADLQQPVRVLLQRYPELRGLLEEKGIHCNECFVAERETLAGVAAMHHLDLELLLQDWERRRAQDANA
ncbi:DUF1858 domain-containing protein [Acidithiobacillus sp. CV18-2]|uniref:DUF1858 domain-containing protein n=1 Tax=Igneacidithiobacillus copahuensis TaxID=2724909 RepID=A0AAE2YRP3_9PROT|nr:DUF1858 domain-containing protein [Igneacidithiobacillus copahuensis]MBU2753327.1 DUF1858 domain-containing protein [Acidithiobacillus sp. CV18-3]MBU2756357.1 DUF1858 domain-containing protein [Acidithiobacillus sp. BN09-2]MBU2776144.1 DUF1858 domain-containing protein [Acidithiobacillus sp. CV18-2]MBU2795757.1 DUF1858 domain-containing protein [Acidithiobacillus sp. VAN18-2]MBU2798751.1 DUF1858 domain-containing protein [Acidithiobacillus sp. VAN18-4]UTV81650.1 DUF1858 domain-containing p